MGGNAGSGGLSNLFGGGSQSFDLTTGAPLGSIGDPTGGVFWANPSNPGVTENAPQQAAQNIQESSYDPTTAQPTTTSPTGSQSGPSTPSWVQNLSNMFLGGQSSPSAQAGLTGGRGGATPAPEIGAATPTPGAAAAAVPPPSAPVPADTSATVSPQSAPISGKTQAVPEVAPAAPAPEPAPAAAAPAPDTTNYPDVSGTSRESGMGPTGPTTIDTGVSASGTGIPPVLQDLFSLNFGRFIADLLGQQGLPAGQNQAAAPRPSADTGDTGTASTETGDAGQKTAQTPAQKAASAVSAVGEAVKPKQSPVESGPGPGAPPSAPAGAAGTATAAPTAPAGAAPGAPVTGQPATGAAAPATAPGPAGTNLMGTGFFDPRTGTPVRVAPQVPSTAPAAAPGATATAPAAPPPGGSDFAAWRDFQLRNSDPETRRMYLENQARPDTAAPAGGQAAGVPAGAAGVPAGAAGASRPPANAPGPINQPPGGQPTPDGGRAPTNGMPGGMTPSAPPPIAGFGAIPNQQGRPRHYEGKLKFEGFEGLQGADTEFRYGTGGGQFPSAPYGTYFVHPGAVGSTGKSIGAWAGYSDSNRPGDNTVHDPVYRGSGGTSARAGVEIHPDVSGRRLLTNGCIGIDRGQSQQFGRIFKAAAATGPIKMTIRPDGGITISPARLPTYVAGGSQSNQYDFDKRVAANRNELIRRVNPLAQSTTTPEQSLRRIRREQNQPAS